MKSLLSKSFVIGILITVVAVAFVSFKNSKMFLDTKASILGEIEQKILLDESEPQLLPQEDIQESLEQASLQVPMFWKYEIISNNGTNNAIHGYIPSLEEYEKWYKFVYDDIRKLEEITDIDSINYNDLRIVKGVANKSEEFAFNKNFCSKILLENRNIGVCPTWINLSNETIPNKSYILVRCPRFDEDQNVGYCLFEDYRKVYYNYAKDMDTECIEKGNSLIYCNIEDYLNILD